MPYIIFYLFLTWFNYYDGCLSVRDTARIMVCVPTAQHLDYKCVFVCAFKESSVILGIAHSCLTMFWVKVHVYVRTPVLEFEKLSAEKMHGE